MNPAEDKIDQCLDAGLTAYFTKCDEAGNPRWEFHDTGMSSLNQYAIKTGERCLSANGELLDCSDSPTGTLYTMLPWRHVSGKVHTVTYIYCGLSVVYIIYR